MRKLVQQVAFAIVLVVCLGGWLAAQTGAPGAPVAPPAQPGDQQALPPDTPQDNTAPPSQAVPPDNPATIVSGQAGQDNPYAQFTPANLPTPKNLDEVIADIIYRERERMKMMEKVMPLVETYIQELKPDTQLGSAPKSDSYFLGKLDMKGGVNDISFLPEPGIADRALKFFTRFFSVDYIPNGFAQMILLDGDGFDVGHYNFKYLRREFLGEIRTMVFDVTPKQNAGVGRFLGRIWVEDTGYNIVRFNGIYTPPPMLHHYFHFDSWRVKMGPGIWLPAYVYSEESDFRYFVNRSLRFKAQTRLWGYDLKHAGRQEEFTAMTVESVQDQTEGAKDNSPLGALRDWQREAEDNVIERLERGGLLAPDSEVNKVLETVISNLEITNNLNIQPEVRARVLLTTPLEAFTIGHTIVLSRGLIDVLPDEPSLAMILSHELAHIVLGHNIDTKYAFNDRMLFSDEKTFKRFGFRWKERDEQAADQKALELLAKSPYADKLANAGLFLKAMDTYTKDLHGLIRPHMGDEIVYNNKYVRMGQLMGRAPALQGAKIDQIAALPLGGRVAVDPWSSRITLARSRPVALLSAREKLPFEVTPFMPYLRSQSTTETAMAGAAGQNAQPSAQQSQQAAPAAAGDTIAPQGAPIADAPQPAGRHNPEQQPGNPDKPEKPATDPSKKPGEPPTKPPGDSTQPPVVPPGDETGH